MRKFRSLRVLIWVVLSLLMLDVAWFFGSRSYLRSDSFLKLVNTPELDFKVVDGYSPWPGYFIFHKFVFTGIAPTTQYQIKADSIAFHLNPFLLFENKVSIRSLTIQDVSIVVSKLGKDQEVVAKEAEEVAEEKAESPETKDEVSPYWTISFPRAVMRDVKEVRIHDWAFLGNAEIKASFWLDTEGLFELGKSRINMKDVRVVQGEKQLGTLAQAMLDSDIDKFDLEDDSLESILPKIATHWKVQGQLDRMDTIGQYIKDLNWLKLDGSALKMSGDVAMADGLWQDNSQLSLSAEALQIKVLEQTIDGRGEVLWTVKPNEPNHLELNFSQFELNKGRDGEGEGFKLVLDTPDKRVNQKFTNWTSDITLPSTRIHRLQFLQAYFPSSMPLKLESGKGNIEGKFRASSDGKDTGGHLNIDLSAMDFRYKDDLIFKGEAKSRTKLSRLDLQKGEIDVSETGIDISNLSFQDQKNWNGSLKLRNAKIKVEKPVHLSSDIEVAGDNLQPVIAFLVKEKDYPKWMLQALDVKNPKVGMHLDASEEKTKVSNLKAKLGPIEFNVLR